ncbi:MULTISPECIES: P1 family peptidase [unclassified Pseudomonas]|uniref:P1 family peptidase n=1 Tax=unclassified Pseudomonas TaxID=196821 RepID=UPI0022874486|nr:MULTISPECIES: P1 family peptidase [Pseudomonas]
MDYLNDECFDTLYLAAVQATEEAVLNAMLAAEDTPMQKPRGLCPAIDAIRLVELMSD